ncbi:MAG: 4Fe-4S binding protein [Dehalococcoidia bacterium]
MAVKVNEANCIGCGSCALLCPQEALEVSASFIVEVDSRICTECLICLNCCSNDALEAP